MLLWFCWRLKRLMFKSNSSSLEHFKTCTKSRIFRKCSVNLIFKGLQWLSACQVYQKLSCHLEVNQRIVNLYQNSFFFWVSAEPNLILVIVYCMCVYVCCVSVYVCIVYVYTFVLCMCIRVYCVPFQCFDLNYISVHWAVATKRSWSHMWSQLLGFKNLPLCDLCTLFEISSKKNSFNSWIPPHAPYN